MFNAKMTIKLFKQYCRLVSDLFLLVIFLLTSNPCLAQTSATPHQIGNPINNSTGNIITHSPTKAFANHFLPAAKPLGQATMRWFGLKIYDAQLWAEKSPTQFNYRDDAHLLELTYARDFEGEKIAEKSRAEIEKQGVGTAEKLNIWQKKLTALIPNVNKGNQLAALYKPGKGLVLFKNGQPVGELNDPELANAFMGIWLDPRSSEPALREKLIGLKP
jgi:Chalcone isomerase-like